MNINTDQPVTVNSYAKPETWFWYGFYFTLGVAVAGAVAGAIVCVAVGLIKQITQ